MSAVQVSRAVRIGLEARFGVLFNGYMQDALDEFLATDLKWAVNFDEVEELPKNFFRGPRSLQELISKDEPILPALAMWTGEVQDLSREKPRQFSGMVAAYWRFFLFVPGLRRDGLVELREAVEAGMVAVLSTQPSSIGYRGDLASVPLQEQELVAQDEDTFGWVQEVTYTATFEVSV